MEEQTCTCTGCKRSNTGCGLKEWPGRQTCGNTLRTRGAARWYNVCTRCMCNSCGKHPCKCPQADGQEPPALPSWTSTPQYPSAEPLQVVNRSCKGSGKAAWPAFTTTGPAGAHNDAMRLIQDLRNRVESLEYEIMMMKNDK